MSKQNISVMASTIMKHVAEGGWLTASGDWHYLKGAKRLNAGELTAAYWLAEERYWRIHGDWMSLVSKQNFESASRGWDEVEL